MFETNTAQSKHIVIFDTLIKESKAEEVEAVLGNPFTDQLRIPYLTQSHSP